MIVISDSTPLISLMKAARLEILEPLFGEVFIPKAWAHQWCRVNIDGTYWICDPYGLYAGSEPSAYAHPYL